MRVVVTVGGLLGICLCFLDGCSRPGPAVRANLERYLSGDLAPGQVEITYTDLHGLWGGLRLTVKGDGGVDQEAVRVATRPAHDLSQEQVRELVGLLIDLRAWEQRVPERPAVPDESQARLLITAGEARTTIWEWYNDMEKNQRLIRIRDRMQKLATKTGSETRVP
jgi:hypothetical protein